jgi:hypothetical protein
MTYGERFQVSGEILAFAGGCDYDLDHHSGMSVSSLQARSPYCGQNVSKPFRLSSGCSFCWLIYIQKFCRELTEHQQHNASTSCIEIDGMRGLLPVHSK